MAVGTFTRRACPERKIEAELSLMRRPSSPSVIRVSPRRSAHRRREGGSSLGRKPCVRWRLKPHKAYEGGDDEDDDEDEEDA